MILIVKLNLAAYQLVVARSVMQIRKIDFNESPALILRIGSLELYINLMVKLGSIGFYGRLFKC